MAGDGRGVGCAVVVVALVAGALAGAACGAVVVLALAGTSPGVATAPVADRAVPPRSSTALTIEGGDSEAIKAAISRADPGVVNVTTIETVVNRWGEYFEVPRGQGTGFVMDAERGLVLTNEHVVRGNLNPVVTVLQPDGSTVELNSRVIAASPADDIAVLQVDADNLPSLEFGDPSSLEVGDWIIAIGSPFGLDHTATVGVVSALGRRFKVPEESGSERIYDDMIQTDAAINSGNSGGPLIDLAGNVVGMNSLITSPSGASAGVGFAISANKLRAVVENLLSEGVIGFQPGIVDPQWLAAADAPEGHYLQVADVVPGSPAEVSGMREGDLILSIGGREVREPMDLRDTLSGIKPGDELEVKVFRYDGRSRGGVMRFQLTVARRGDL